MSTKKIIMLNAVLAACIALSGCKKDEQKKDTTMENVTTEITQESTTTEEPSYSVIASGEGESTAATQTDSIIEPAPTQFPHHENAEEQIEGVTFKNTDAFTERSFDLGRLYTELQNYIYKSSITAKLIECDIQIEESSEYEKIATLYFDDSTSRKISILWVSNEYRICDYAPPPSEDDVYYTPEEGLQE